MIIFMTIGNVLEVFRTSDQAAEECIGAGLVIHPQIVQLDGGAARLLRDTPHRADQIALRDSAGGRWTVERIRPGLVGHQEASAIVAEHMPGVVLLPVDGELVYLEVANDVAAVELDPRSDNDGPIVQPWWCSIVCTSACTSC